MRWLPLVAVVMLAAALPTFAVAVDSFTVTADADVDADIGSGWVNSFKVIKAAWKADSSGDKANGTIAAHKGKLIMVTTNPGTTAPADNYDLTIIDSTGADIAGGALANRDTANVETVIPLAHNSGTVAFTSGRPFFGPLTVTFTQQANANCDGEIYLFVEE